MAAIRNMVISEVAFPSFIGKATQSVGGAIGLMLIPLILIGALIFGVNGGEFGFLSRTTIDFSYMIHQVLIEIIFLPAAAFAVITGFLGIRKLIGGLKEQYPPGDNGDSLIASLVGTVKDIMTHEKFRECGTNKQRNIAHMSLFYGFGGLLITTLGVTAIYYVNLIAVQMGSQPPLTPTPLPFLHPIKIIGNISAVAVMFGIGYIVVRRLFNEKMGKSVAFDWIFIGVILLIAATGILSQVTRVAGNQIAYFIYYVHLVLVFFLFAFAPHSKFGHMFYRTAALVYSRYSGRSKSVGVNLLGNTKQVLPEKT